MLVKDKELQNLVAEKQIVIKQFDQNIINEEQYNKRFQELEIAIKKKIDSVLQAEMKKEKNKMEETKMSEEEQPKKIGKKPQDNSNASVVAKVLMDKSVKNIDEAVAKFDELKPGREKPKIKATINVIIRETKQGKGRWQNYTWDEEKYQLSAKA